jgi:hypothetical protein
LVLDHLIVESLDNNEEKLDVQALLLHGLKALFEDTEDKDIKYDDNDIDKLLDRSQIEETVDKLPSKDVGLRSFKTARIWANSTAQLEDLEDTNEILEVGYWDRIIQERRLLAEAEKLAALEEIGRGKRRTSKKVYIRFLSNVRSIILSLIRVQGNLFSAITLNRHPTLKMKTFEVRMGRRAIANLKTWMTLKCMLKLLTFRAHLNLSPLRTSRIG